MKKFSVAIVSEQREREAMEDTHCVVPNFAGNKDWLFAGVFDGHGGKRVAAGLADNMASFVRKGIIAGEELEEVYKSAYAEAAGAEWAQKNLEGSCATTFLVQKEILTCANVGDCRIVVVGNSARQLTRDHDVGNKTEVKRVVRCGAGIYDIYVDYENELLAPTRAIGDLHFRDAGVIPVPFISRYRLKQTDRFIVAASDGLFGRTSNKRVFALSRGVRNAAEFVQALKQEVEQREEEDNITIIVVQVK